MKTIAILLFAVIAITTSLEIPSNFKTCKRSDPNINECLREAVKVAIVILADGLKSFRVMPIEPMKIDKLKIGESNNSVSLKQEFNNVKIYGLTKSFELKSSKLDLDKLIIRMEALHSEVTFRADYKIDGRILFLPLHGEGKCNITMHDLLSKHDLYFEKYRKNGEIYLKILKYNVKLSPKHLSMYFDNFFDDKALTEQLNKILNEESAVFYKEIEESYEQAFSLILSQIAENIFSRVPFNKIL